MKRQFLSWSKAVSQDALFQWMEPERPLSTSVEAACVCKSQDDNELCSEGSNCLNRITETYCTHHVCKNKMPNECPDILIHNYGSKGWGLKSTRTIPSGTFLCQYLGKSLNEAAVREQGENNYLLRLGDIFIDAKRQGNQARFLNHSCDPNCDLLKRNDGDRPCAVIITNREILPNKELTINYRWDSGVECHCGASNCTKFIGRPQKGRSQNRPTRDNHDLLGSGQKRQLSPPLNGTPTKRSRQAPWDVAPLGFAAAVSSTDGGKYFASNDEGLPYNGGSRNCHQSRMRWRKARCEDPTPPSRTDCGSPLTDSFRSQCSEIQHLLDCNLSENQQRCIERQEFRNSGMTSKTTGKSAPTTQLEELPANIHDPIPVTSRTTTPNLGVVSSASKKTLPPLREVFGVEGVGLVPDNRESDDRSSVSSGELRNEPDGVPAAEMTIRQVIHVFKRINSERDLRGNIEPEYNQILAYLKEPPLNWPVAKWVPLLQVGKVSSSLECILRMIAWIGVARSNVPKKMLKIFHSNGRRVPEQTTLKWLHKGEIWLDHVNKLGVGVLLLIEAARTYHQNGGLSIAEREPKILVCLEAQVYRIANNNGPDVLMFLQSLKKDSVLENRCLETLKMVYEGERDNFDVTIAANLSPVTVTWADTNGMFTTKCKLSCFATIGNASILKFAEKTITENTCVIAMEKT
ncbi:histone-lysine N-methyltransferase ASH1L [Apiospora saccharicola]